MPSDGKPSSTEQSPRATEVAAAHWDHLSSTEFDQLDKMRKAEIMALYLLECRMSEVIAYDNRPKGKAGADSLDGLMGGLGGIS